MSLKAAVAFFLVFFFAAECMSQGSVKLATLEWEPYISPKAGDNGYVAEVVREAFKRANYSVEITFLPWARAVAETEYGDFDGVFPEYLSESRAEKYVFSDPFPGGPVGLYKRMDNTAVYSVSPQEDPTRALFDLQAYRFGVVRGYINTAEFDQASILKKDVVTSDTTNLMMLYNGRVDFIFIDKLTAEYIIHSQFPHYREELEFMLPAFASKSLHIAFSKQAVELERKVNAFNSGLQQITKDGTLAEIIRTHGLEKAF